MSERLTRGTLDIEQATRIMYGLNERDSISSFLKAAKQQDISPMNADALPRGEQSGMDYTTFGKLRKIKL